MEDVDLAPAGLRRLDRRGEGALLGHVRFERDALAALLARETGRLFGRREVAVHREDLRAFLDEPQRCSAAVSQALARALPCADDDGDLVLQAHSLPLTAVSMMPASAVPAAASAPMPSSPRTAATKSVTSAL